MSLPIYLDYNATTPVDPTVLAELLPFLDEHFGNPASAHAYGHAAHAAVEKARAGVAALLGCDPGEIIFTGSGTEANNLAIIGTALAGQSRHIITSAVEHPAVLQPCRYLAEVHGFRISQIPVDGYGRVDPDGVRRAIGPDTALITVMHAQNETGTLQPVAEIAAVAAAAGIPFHTDAAQTVGKVRTRVTELGVDMLTVAGHKVYAPKGIGALYVRRGTPIRPVIRGAGQERGLRPGTENVAFMIALGAACRIAGERLTGEEPRLRSLRDRLQEHLLQVPGAAVNGHLEQRLPNTLSIRFPGVVGNDVLAAVPEVAAATGSACHAGTPEPSAVLLAMGIPAAEALGTLRLSLGRGTRTEDVDQAAAYLWRAVTALRNGPLA